MDFLGESDAFVKVYLFPQHDVNQVNLKTSSMNIFDTCWFLVFQLLKTKVVEWSVNPVFNETFRFQVDCPFKLKVPDDEV